MDFALIFLIFLVLFFSFSLASNDVTMSPVIGSRALSIKSAVIFGGILSFIGCYFFSAGVGKTVGQNLINPSVNYDIPMMLAVVLSTSIWLIIASFTGAPISSTHSVVGSVFGVCIVWAIDSSSSFLDSLNWTVLGNVVLNWIISPMIAFILGYVFQWILKNFLKKFYTNLLKIESIEKFSILFLIITVVWMQISRSGNDSGKVVGFFFALTQSGDIQSNLVNFLIALAGITAALGLILVGKNVLKTVEGSIIGMRPTDAISVALSITITITLYTALGLPISASHTVIFAMFGASRMKGERPEKKSYHKMIKSWFLTFPIAAGLAALFYSIFLIFQI